MQTLPDASRPQHRVTSMGKGEPRLSDFSDGAAPSADAVIPAPVRTVSMDMESYSRALCWRMDGGEEECLAAIALCASRGIGLPVGLALLRHQIATGDKLGKPCVIQRSAERDQLDWRVRSSTRALVRCWVAGHGAPRSCDPAAFLSVGCPGVARTTTGDPDRNMAFQACSNCNSSWGISPWCCGTVLERTSLDALEDLERARQKSLLSHPLTHVVLASGGIDQAHAAIRSLAKDVWAKLCSMHNPTACFVKPKR